MSDTDETLEVLKALVVLRRALRTSRITGETAPRLPVAQVQVLLHLAQSGPITMTGLARQLGVSCPAATDLVDRLVAADRVERLPHTTDRRKVMVQLTPSARQFAEGALAERRKKVDEVLRQLPSQQRTGFVRGIQMLANTLVSSAGVALANIPGFAQEAALGAALA